MQNDAVRSESFTAEKNSGERNEPLSRQFLASQASPGRHFLASETSLAENFSKIKNVFLTKKKQRLNFFFKKKIWKFHKMAERI